MHWLISYVFLLQKSNTVCDSSLGKSETQAQASENASLSNTITPTSSEKENLLKSTKYTSFETQNSAPVNTQTSESMKECQCVVLSVETLVDEDSEPFLTTSNTTAPLHGQSTLCQSSEGASGNSFSSIENLNGSSKSDSSTPMLRDDMTYIHPQCTSITKCILSDSTIHYPLSKKGTENTSSTHKAKRVLGGNNRIHSISSDSETPSSLSEDDVQSQLSLNDQHEVLSSSDYPSSLEESDSETIKSGSDNQSSSSENRHIDRLVHSSPVDSHPPFYKVSPNLAQVNNRQTIYVMWTSMCNFLTVERILCILTY